MLGWFRRGARTSSTPRSSSLPAGALSRARGRQRGSHAERAVDALGGVLRGFGEYAFDVDDAPSEETAARCEAWSRHLLVGAPHPDRPGEPATARDWPGFQQFFLRHRADEAQFVARMRELFVQMLGDIRGLFSQSIEEDAQLVAELAALRAESKGASLEELRDRVDATVRVVNRSLADRQRRHRDEVRTLGNHIRKMKGDLADARRDAATDGLTELYNRSAFDEHIRAVGQIANCTAGRSSLLMIDVDHFKRLNDTHGHAFGDRALRAVADALVRAAPRSSDFVARYGGEEFAIVLDDTPAKGACRVAEKVLEATRRIALHKEGKGDATAGDPVRVTVSVGVASFREGEEPQAWIERADAALYAAKDGGRDRYVQAG